MHVVLNSSHCPISQWLEADFLKYLEEWEIEASTSGRSPSEQKKMCLSEETIEGLRITSMCSTIAMFAGKAILSLFFSQIFRGDDKISIEIAR